MVKNRNKFRIFEIKSALPMTKRFSLFTLLFFILNLVYAQNEGGDFCSVGKIKAFTNAKRARLVASTSVSDERIDVNYYKLNLTVNYDRQTIKGSTLIGFKNVVENLSAVKFELKSEMKVDSVRIGRFILPFQQANNDVNITLDKIYKKDDKLQVEIFYGGTPPNSSAFTPSFKFSKHGQNGSPLISTLSEPFGASDWFPCKNSLTDKADSSDVIVTAASNFVTVSNGKLQSVKENGNGTNTYTWKSRYPIAHYLISLAMTNYERYDNVFTATDGTKMPVTHYIYPETNTASTKLNLDQTVIMLGYFSDKFGLYPFLKEKYGHAQFDWGGGMEHQTCSSMVNFSGYLVAHELAHQWFGDKITCQSWENIWLNEGFATYAEALYAELVNGKAGYESNITVKLERAKLARGTIYVQKSTDENEIFNNNRTYSKGATVLHMLRGAVGEETFFKIIKTYMASKFAYKTATTEDFQSIVEEVSGKKFDYFFKQWIYGENYPKYSYTWQIAKKSAAGYSVTVDVAQQSNTNPLFFTMPITFKIKTESGDVVQQVLNDKPSQRFIFETASLPNDVILDPDNFILKEAGGTSLLALSNETTTPHDAIKISPNPVLDSFSMTFMVDKTGETKIDLVAMNGVVVAQLLNENLKAGSYQRIFKLPNLSAGKYILRLQANTQQQTEALVIE